MTTDRRQAAVVGAAFMVALLASMAGCRSMRQWGRALAGEQTQRDIYLNLMTPEQRDVLLFMESEEQDEERRLLYVQEIGVWQRWQAVPEAHRETIRKRQIAEGFTRDEVRMAWGPPDAVADMTSPAERAEGHERLVWQWGLRDDAAGYTREVVFLDDRVLSYRDLR